jgi:hypothetical protein
MSELAAYSRESLDTLRSRNCFALGHVSLGPFARHVGREGRNAWLRISWSHSDDGDAWPGQQKRKASSCIEIEDVSQMTHGREDIVTSLKGRCKPFGTEHRVALARSVEAPGGTRLSARYDTIAWVFRLPPTEQRPPCSFTSPANVCSNRIHFATHAAGPFRAHKRAFPRLTRSGALLTAPHSCRAYVAAHSLISNSSRHQRNSIGLVILPTIFPYVLFTRANAMIAASGRTTSGHAFGPNRLRATAADPGGRDNIPGFSQGSSSISIGAHAKSVVRSLSGSNLTDHKHALW